MECPNCGGDVYDGVIEYDCPFCGEEVGEGFYRCENCGTLVYTDGELWECFHCQNEGSSSGNRISITFTCPECGAEMDDDDYCFSCGWPNNEGWIGENY